MLRVDCSLLFGVWCLVLAVVVDCWLLVVAGYVLFVVRCLLLFVLLCGVCCCLYCVFNVVCGSLFLDCRSLRVGCWLLSCFLFSV